MARRSAEPVSRRDRPAKTALTRAGIVARPSGPHYLALETVLDLLGAGGVPDAQAAWGLDALLQMATATAAEQGLRSVAGDARDEEERLTAAIRNAPQDRYPRNVALGDDLLPGTGPDRLEWMLTAFINGILRTSR
jgi:hypothetical protein